MTHLDRLSSLLVHFEIRTKPAAHKANANLIITGEDGTPEHVRLIFTGQQLPCLSAPVLVAISIDFGGQSNPVLEALPAFADVDLHASPDLKPLAELIVSEVNTKRCGAQIALDRLCEFLLVNVLRKEIEANRSDTGLLAGLANANLSPVLVAIHDQPGKQWKLDDLVQLSAMSRSQFMEAFQAILGKPPMAYLKQWRMTLARNALLKGDRVKEIARRFGYGSGDAFTRAFTQTYGMAPTKLSSEITGNPLS